MVTEFSHCELNVDMARRYERSPFRLRILRNRRHYQSPINGAFETNRSFVPRRKRLG